MTQTPTGSSAEETVSANAVPAEKTLTADAPSPKSQSTTVVVNTEKTSVLLFLIAFFLPFLTPLIALAKGQIGFLFLILALWLVSLLLLAIPILGWFLVFVINVFIAVKVSKLTGKTKVTVTPNQ